MRQIRIAKENGPTALDIITKEQRKIHAILLDLVMPDMDGFEVMLKLRESKIIEKVPVMESAVCFLLN